MIVSSDFLTPVCLQYTEFRLDTVYGCEVVVLSAIILPNYELITETTANDNSQIQ